MTRPRDWRRIAAGLIFAAFGAFAVIFGQRYALGSPTRVGPGGFPLLLGIVLMLLGAGHLVTAAPNALAPDDSQVSWRAILCIGASVLTFGLTVDRIGLVLAIIVSTWIACLGHRGRLRIVETAILSVVLAAFGAGVFVYGLGLSFTLFPVD